jgi:hypothetical protein
LLYRSERGSSGSKLALLREEGGVYFYENSNAIYSGEDRKFYVYSNDFKTDEQFLVLPYAPEEIPFTDWTVLSGMKSNGVDSVQLEFRYKVTK